MCESLNLFGYSTFDQFIKDIETNPLPDIESSESLCVEIEKEVKSVRFSEEIKEMTFNEPRVNNICPKYNLPNSSEDVNEMFCKSGMYLEDEEQQLDLIENNIFNNGDKVNDKELKKLTNIITKHQIKLIREKNKLTNVREVVTDYLTGDKNILDKVSQSIIIDCVIYMMEVYEHLEKEDSSYTFDYKSGVTISNREGKRQREFLKKKIDYVTNKYF